MAYVAVDKDGSECKFLHHPERCEDEWMFSGKYEDDMHWELSKDSIEKLIGRKLTWEDEPVELKES